MDWISDHWELIAAIAGAIAYWLNARKKDQAGEPADYDGDGKPDVHTGGARSMREHADTLEQEANTRRIQEEIRRKIAERQAGGDQAPRPFYPAPHLPYQRVEADAQARREQEETARREEAARETAVVLERQQALANQLAALQARRAEAEREGRSVWAAQQTALASAAGGSVREDVSLLSELRSARSLRKAIVLREVLGAPVGLR